MNINKIYKYYLYKNIQISQSLDGFLLKLKPTTPRNVS